MPELKEIVSSPPSRAVMQVSSESRLGVDARMYAYLRENSPSGSRSNVVDVCSGGVTAPVDGSTLRPAWMLFVWRPDMASIISVRSLFQPRAARFPRGRR